MRNKKYVNFSPRVLCIDDKIAGIKDIPDYYREKLLQLYTQTGRLDESTRRQLLRSFETIARDVKQYNSAYRDAIFIIGTTTKFDRMLRTMLRRNEFTCVTYAEAINEIKTRQPKLNHKGFLKRLFSRFYK
jgi:hypothetical protein